MQDEKTKEMYGRMQTLAEGRLSCECGNMDWKQFLYVDGGLFVTAGCKHCGAIHEYNGTRWFMRSKGILK